jgi:hypothetical protein
MHIRLLLLIVATALLPTAANAACELVSGPCTTDRNGNYYRTEQNLGGGYNTYKNGVLNSQTSQTLGGSWRERFNDGQERTYNYNPYARDTGTYGPYGTRRRPY